jgi:hypothetical protein
LARSNSSGSFIVSTLLTASLLWRVIHGVVKTVGADAAKLAITVRLLGTECGYSRCNCPADCVETLFTGALASIGLEILSEFFEPGIFGL